MEKNETINNNSMYDNVLRKNLAFSNLFLVEIICSRLSISELEYVSLVNGQRVFHGYINGSFILAQNGTIQHLNDDTKSVENNR